LFIILIILDHRTLEIIGKVDSGDVSKISMENNNGVVISTLTTGATLQEFLVPTETGALKNIVLGFSDYEDYYKNNLCSFLGRL